MSLFRRKPDPHKPQTVTADRYLTDEEMATLELGPYHVLEVSRFTTGCKDGRLPILRTKTITPTGMQIRYAGWFSGSTNFRVLEVWDINHDGSYSARAHKLIVLNPEPEQQ